MKTKVKVTVKLIEYVDVEMEVEHRRSENPCDLVWDEYGEYADEAMQLAKGLRTNVEECEIVELQKVKT